MSEYQNTVERPSPALTNWLKEYDSEVREAIGDVERTGIARAWTNIVELLRRKEAPADLVAEAERLQPQPATDISKQDRQELHRLARDFRDPSNLRASSLEDVHAVIDRRVESGGLSRHVAERLKATLAEPDVDWSWSACGFCAALGFIEGGLVGAAVGCIFCGAVSR
jgi:hypothetical protein